MNRASFSGSDVYFASFLLGMAIVVSGLWLVPLLLLGLFVAVAESR